MLTEIATRNEIASVRIARTERGAFEYAVSNPFGGKKLVFIISTLYGCPVGCPICDAGGAFRGVIGKEEMGVVIRNLFEEHRWGIPSRFSRVKIQFSRMGEPAFNGELPSFIDGLCEEYSDVKPVFSLSSVAPESSDGFFSEFMEVVEKRSPRNEFQLQFSIHSTDDKERDILIPVKKWISEEFHR